MTLIRQYILNLRLRLDAPFPSQLKGRTMRGGTYLRLVSG